MADIINPFEWFGNDREVFLDFTMQLARVIIGLQVLFTGCNLPKQYIKKEWVSLFVLLLPVMTCGWMCTGLLVWAIVPGLTYLEALVVSACVTPTDPVLANSICKGMRRTQTRIRLISREIRRNVCAAQCARSHSKRVRCERWPGTSVPHDGNLSRATCRAWLHGFSGRHNRQMVSIPSNQH